MKKLYTLFAALTISAMAFSQSYDWNFSNEEFNTLGTIAETTTIDGLTIYSDPANSKAIIIDGSKKTVEGVDYTHRLKFGGTGGFDKETGQPTGRVLSFDVEGNGTITVVITSGSNGATRELSISAGSKENEVGTITTTDAVTLETFKYEGGANTIFLYSKSSGLNLYRITFTPATSTSIKPVLTDANVVSVEYYNIGGLSLGNKFEVLPGGIYVEITKYDNGTVTSKKIVKRNN